MKNKKIVREFTNTGFKKINLLLLVVFMLVFVSLEISAVEYLQTDKEIYVVGEIVTISIQTQNGRFIDVITPTEKYSLCGEAGIAQKFMPSETGTYNVILRDEINILATKSFEVSSNNKFIEISDENKSGDELISFSNFSNLNNVSINENYFGVFDIFKLDYTKNIDVQARSKIKLMDGNMVIRTSKDNYELNEIVNIKILSDKKLEKIVIYSEDSEYNLIVTEMQENKVMFIPTELGQYLVAAKFINDQFYYGSIFFVNKNSEKNLSNVSLNSLLNQSRNSNGGEFIINVNVTTVNNSNNYGKNNGENNSSNIILNLTENNLTYSAGELYYLINNNLINMSLINNNMVNESNNNYSFYLQASLQMNTQNNNKKHLVVKNSQGEEKNISMKFFKNIKNEKIILKDIIVDDSTNSYVNLSSQVSSNSSNGLLSESNVLNELSLIDLSLIDLSSNELESHNQISEDQILQFEKYDVEVILENSSVKKLNINDLVYVQNINLGVDALPKEKYNLDGKIVTDAFAINLDGTLFTETTASLTAKGDELWKCALWNFTDQSCMGSWEKLMDLKAGSDYNITLYPGDPGYLETYTVFQSTDVDLITLDNDTFVVAMVDSAAGYNISFQVWNANGSTLTDKVVVDATGGATSRVTLTPINKTHFVLSIFDQPQNNIDFFVYDRNGNSVVGRTNAAATVGANTDVKICQIGDRFPLVYSRTSNGDAELKIYNNSGVQITGVTQIDTNMAPELPSQNLVSCTAINNTVFTYFWFDDATNDATFVVRSNTGVSIVGATDYDADVGETAQLATAGLGNNRFVAAYYDSTDDDITLDIRQLSGATVSTVLAATDIDTNAGTDSRIDVAAIQMDSTNYFAVVWIDRLDTTIKAGVYNQSGFQITAPFNVTTTPNLTYPMVAIAGFEPVIKVGLCNGTFLVAYTNATMGSLIQKYWYNGTRWDGVCPDYIAPVIELNEPVNDMIIESNSVSFNFTGTDDRDALLSNCTLWSNFTSSWQKNITIYNVGSSVKTNITKTEITDGIYVWNVECTDNSSNYAFSISNYTLKINNQTPYIRNLEINQTIINQSEKIKFNSTITDSFGILNASISVLYPNGTTLNHVLIGSGNEYYYIINETMQLGTYNVTMVYAFDNLNQTSVNISSLYFIVTASPPEQFDLISPYNLTESQNLLPTFNWSQTIDANFANYTILITRDETFNIMDFTYFTTNITNTSIVPQFALDTNAEYYWKVMAFDIFGNQRNSTQYLKYITDIVGPSVTLESPSNNSFWIQSNVNFNYTPTDTNTIQTCYLYGNFTGVFLENKSNSSIIKNQQNTFSLQLSEGIYLWNIFCVDNATNSKFALENNTLYVDLSGPIISLITPENNSLENNTNNVVFIVNVSDKFTNISECSLYVDGVYQRTKYNLQNGVEFNFTNFMLNGNYSWNVFCTDANGFSAISTKTYNLTVEVVDRNPPLVTLNYPLSNQYLQSGDITFNYTPEDATGITNCSLYIDGIYNKSNETIVQNFEYNYFNVLNIAEEGHTWKVICFDNSTGLNEGTSNTKIVYIDTINPNVLLEHPGNLTVMSNWYDSNFEYRIGHKINGTSYGTLNNYSINIIVHYGAGTNNGNEVYLGSKSKTDFGDIRFINSNNDGELGYYLENKTDSDRASFWVMLPSIDITNGAYMYIYYGNNDAITTSNGTNAFDFFDDFSNGLDNWEIDPQNTDAVIINDSIGNPNPSLVHYPDSSQTKNAYYDTRIRTKDYKIANGIIDYDLYISGTSRAIHQFGWRVNNLSFTSGYAWRLQSSSADGGFFEFTNGAWAQFGTAYGAISQGTWYHVSINVNSSNYDSSVAPGTSVLASDGTKITEDYLSSHVHATGTDYYVMLDNVRVRKFASPEPMDATWDAEEKRSIVSIEYLNVSDVIFSYTPSDANLANCSLYGNFTGSFLLDQNELNPQNIQVNEFTKTLNDGLYYWTVECSDLSGRLVFSTLNYSFQIDTKAPEYSNILISPETLVEYNSSRQYSFNISWLDDVFVTSVILETNLSGSMLNTTLNSSNEIYSFIINNLSAGNYMYKWYSEDEVGNKNETLTFEYIINQSSSEINLTFNSTEGNMSINEDSYVNMTAQLINPIYGQVLLYLDQIEISEGVSQVTNITYFEDPGFYEITAEYVETQNYSAINKTYYIEVNDTTPPLINLIRPNNNGRTSSGESILQYNVSDKSNIANCSLYINEIYNQTVTSVTRDETQLFTAMLEDGDYTWKVTCFDLSGNQNTSLTRNMTAVSSNLIDLNVTPQKIEFEKGELAQINTASMDIFENILLTNMTTNIIKGNTSLLWWNSSWQYRKQMIINNTVSRQRLETIDVNITNLTGYITSCNEIRIVRNYTVNNSPENEIIPLEIISGNTNSCIVRFTANLTANMINGGKYFVYFGNPDATGNPGFTITRAGLRVQRGVVVGAATTLTATLSEVVLANTFVIFTANVGSSRPDRLEYTQSMTLGTEINFARYGTTTSGAISWEAIESTDAYVQRSSTTYTAAQISQNITINAVNLSRAFILVDGRSSGTTAATINQGFFTGSFINSTTISIGRGTTGSTATVSWQVVELNNSYIQGNITSFTGAGTTINVSQINVSRSIIVLSRSVNGATGIGSNYVNGRILNATQISLNRTYAVGTINVSWFLIELPEEYFVESNVLSISTADINQAVSEVNPTKAFNVQSWSSTGTTSTTYTNSIVNVNLTTSTNLFFDKYSTTQTLEVPWFLAESSHPQIGFASQHELMQISNGQTDDFGVYGILFNTSNKTYGTYSAVSLATKDTFKNSTAQNTFEIIPDVTPPNVTLVTPYDFEERGVGYVNFSYIPYDINLNNCTLYIDINGTFVPNGTQDNPLNNETNLISNIFVDIGLHEWNIGCKDIEGNLGFAESNRSINITGPDLIILSNDIWFGLEERIEGVNITIYANITNNGLTAANNSFIVQFYNGDPLSGGILIENKTVLNLSILEKITLNTTLYVLKAGRNNIYVRLDPTNVVNETTETNNIANKYVSVSAYQYYYGNVSAKLVLGEKSQYALMDFYNLSPDEGIILFADEDSNFAFTDLVALTRNTNAQLVSDDLSNIDEAMNISGFDDSIQVIWGGNTNVPLETQTFQIASNMITDVPVVNSTTDSSFVTGILWDSADDTGNLQYDVTDEEDVIFVTEINSSQQGAFGVYDTEIKIPAALREYKAGNDKVVMYIELK
ncbi:MAG: DUF2341 domain-containing protein [Candidatus Woesearchaeota archaeon]|jgi:hypothetical protein